MPPAFQSQAKPERIEPSYECPRVSELLQQVGRQQVADDSSRHSGFTSDQMLGPPANRLRKIPIEQQSADDGDQILLVLDLDDCASPRGSRS